MVKRKQIIAYLLSLVMIFSLMPTVAFAAENDDVTVTIRIEALEKTLGSPRELTVSYKALSDYGLTGDEPGMITPLHVLAEYFDSENSGSAAGSIELNSYGGLNTINGYNGSINNDSSSGWMYTVNNKTPMDGDGFGYNINDYPVKNGDEIVIYGVKSNYPTAFYNSYFSNDTYEVESGEPVDLELSGFNIWDFSENPTVSKLSNATILADQVTTERPTGGAVSSTYITTDSNGKAELVFTTPGTYDISAVRGTSTDISRPYAKVTVTESTPEEDQAVVDSDKTELSITTETSVNLNLPTKGASGKTSIKWTSGDTDIITDNGKVVRPDYGSPAAIVTMTADITKNAATTTKAFSVKVLPYTEVDVVQVINDIKRSIGTSFTASEDTHTNLIASLQAKADNVANGSVISIKISSNPAIQTTGVIIYGTTESTGKVLLNISLSGVKEEHEISTTVPAHKKTKQEALDEDADSINWAKIKNKNTSPEAVTGNLSLPTSGTNYTSIAWTSSNTDVVSPSYGTGTVKRPAYGSPDASVTLKATISEGAYMSYFFSGDAVPTERSIDITVSALTAEEYNAAVADVDAVASQIQSNDTYKIREYISKGLADLNQIDGDLSLYTTNINGASLTWGSSNIAIEVNYAKGNVTRPEVGEQDVNGQLYVDITKLGYTTRVAFNTTVKALTKAEVDKEIEYMNSVKDALVFDTIKGTNVDVQNVVSDMSLVYRGIVSSEGITWSNANRGDDGVEIKWTSSDPESNIEPYKTNRPSLNGEDKTVTMTATISSQKILRSTSVPAITKEISYTVKAYSNKLTNISVSSAGIVESFDKDINSYTAKNIPYNCGSVEIDIERQDPTATVIASGASLDSNGRYSVNIDSKEKIVTFAVKSNNVTNTYSVKLIREASPLPEYDSEWSIFRGDKENTGKVNSKVARVAGEATKKWSFNLETQNDWSPVGSPVIVNNNIYITTDDNIHKIDKNGNVLKSGKLKSSIGYTSNIAYGDGKIFVPLGNGQIQAMNADTLESLWISQEMPEIGYQAGCTITYHDGYIYTGTYSYTSDLETDGYYFAMTTNDEDVDNESEEKTFSWTHSSSSITGLKAYYGAGGAVYKDSIIFAGDDGILVSKNLKTGAENAIYALQGRVRSSVMISDDTAYVSTQSGRIYSVPINNDGTFNEAKIKYCETSNGSSTSSPVKHAGKLYVLSGEFGDNSVIDVINADTMKKISSADIGGYSQSSPLIVDTYSTPANDNTVFMYVMLNDEKDDMVVIENNDLLTKPKVSKLFSPGGSYSMASITADNDGTMYFTGNSNYLYALSSKKFPYAVNETYTVKFNSNGGTAIKSKTVTNGFTYGTLSTPTKKGYKFGGWYTSLTGGSQVKATSSVNLKRDITLYARWSPKSYKINYNANKGKVSKKTKNIKYNAKIGTLSTPKRKGYNFVGWYTKKKGGTAYTGTMTYKKDGNITIYARWTKKKVVKFNGNKGTVSLNGKAVKKGNKYGKLPTPKRDGYKFKGWYTKKKGGSKVTKSSKVRKSGNHTVYAQWKKK